MQHLAKTQRPSRIGAGSEREKNAIALRVREDKKYVDPNIHNSSKKKNAVDVQVRT